MCFMIPIFAKYILFALNFLVMICGILLIALGAVLFTHISELPGLSYIYNIVCISVMGLGGLIIILALVGCCGAYSQNCCLLCYYVSIMVFLGIVELSLGIFLLHFVSVSVDALDESIRESTEEIFNQYLHFQASAYGETVHAVKEKVEEFQQNYVCCGVQGAEDYSVNSMQIPDSCCDHEKCTESNSYAGCALLFGDTIKTYAHAVAGVSIGFAVLEFLCAALACSACIKQQDQLPMGRQVNQQNEAKQEQQESVPAASA